MACDAGTQRFVLALCPACSFALRGQLNALPLPIGSKRSLEAEKELFSLQGFEIVGIAACCKKDLQEVYVTTTDQAADRVFDCEWLIHPNLHWFIEQ